MSGSGLPQGSMPRDAPHAVTSRLGKPRRARALPAVPAALPTHAAVHPVPVAGELLDRGIPLCGRCNKVSAAQASVVGRSSAEHWPQRAATLPCTAQRTCIGRSSSPAAFSWRRASSSGPMKIIWRDGVGGGRQAGGQAGQWVKPRKEHKHQGFAAPAGAVSASLRSALSQAWARPRWGP